MADALTTYLDDHLAGAKFATSLVADLRDNGPQPLRAFAERLLEEIEEDRQILIRLAESQSEGRSSVKEATAWLAQKASRIKLSPEDQLGAFEALEFLCVGIEGKRLMWTALQAVVGSDSRLRDLDFQALIERAIDQQQRVDQARLDAARHALTTVTESVP